MAMNMRGSLNVSQYQKTPAQPRFYGKALIHGVEYVIKGWEKESDRGPWISLLFEDPLHGDPAAPAATVAAKPSVFSKPLPEPRARVEAPAAFDNRRDNPDLFDDVSF